MSGQGTDLYLSPDEQDLLVAALNSNQHGGDPKSLTYTPNTQTNPGSGQLDFSDESPYLDFDPDGDFDDSNFDFDPNSRMIGDLPDDDSQSHLHDKRKSLADKDDDDEDGGGKRREGEDKTSKKPGRKPLTSEPTSKRKAQNRAAQRAFRERKEKHLKDLETKVEDLEKASDAANHENGLLRAQVERLQVELKEYRKRLSWISSNGVSRSPSTSTNKPKNAIGGPSDFQFEFPKFGDLPAMSATNMFNSNQKPQGTNTARSSTLPAQTNGSTNGANGTSRSNSRGQTQRQTSQSQSPLTTSYTASPQQQTKSGSVDSLSGLFSPSILEASRHASLGGYFPNSMKNIQQRGSQDNPNGSGVFSNSSISNTDSPGSSSESHTTISSIGTSPEPSLSSPGNKFQDLGLNTINEENNQFGLGKDKICKEISRACGCAEDPIPPILNMSNGGELAGYGNTNGISTGNDISWLAQQNNGNFDPVLFGDYRETQDNLLSQDFGSFFNDAYPLPDLGSPLHNYTEVAPEAAKVDLIRQVDAAKEGQEVVPANDNPMSCNKIWDRLQSMEKFRNGEIDIDNLCSELRAKAKCSEGGAVVDKKDVDKILGSAR